MAGECSFERSKGERFCSEAENLDGAGTRA